MDWYKHLEFQKSMRKILNDFQSRCNEFKDERYFVDNFKYDFYDNLDFYLIEDSYDRESLEQDLSIAEPWNFIMKKPSFLWNQTIDLHKKIKKSIKGSDFIRLVPEPV